MRADIIKSRLDNSGQARIQQPPIQRKPSITHHARQSVEELQSRFVSVTPAQMLEVLTKHFTEKGYSYHVIAEVISISTPKDFVIHCSYDFSQQTTKVYIQQGDTYFEFYGWEDTIRLIDNSTKQ